MARPSTNRLLEMIEEGLVDREHVIVACLKYMSEREVVDMMIINGFLDGDADFLMGPEEDDEEDNGEEV